MFTTTRYFFPNGIEGEEMKTTVLSHETYDSALSYCHRYSSGIRFAGVTIENETGTCIYELLDSGEEIVYADEK